MENSSKNLWEIPGTILEKIAGGTPESIPRAIHQINYKGIVEEFMDEICLGISG